MPVWSKVDIFEKRLRGGGFGAAYPFRLFLWGFETIR
jgi:hypothetical protein